MDAIISFFTDPWSVQLAKWTMSHIFSAAIQLGAGYLALQLLNVVLGALLDR